MPEVIGIDHVYFSVSNMARSEVFYDIVLGQVLGFRKNRFSLNGDAHVQYYNSQFGIVLRPARVLQSHEPYAPGMHHFCLRVDSVADVVATVEALQALGVPATPAQCWPDYASDYWATFFTDPDGLRLEVTNFRHERRERMQLWESLV